MKKYMSDRERRLQKLLIPLNIVVCIICLVAMVSLVFLPILKIDVGKILRNENFIEIVDEKLSEEVGGSLEGTEQAGIDFKPVVFSIVKNVLGSAEGAITVSAFDASKVFFASEDDKADKVLDSLLFGENALVNKLIDSIVDGVADIFETDEGKTVLEEVVVSALVTAITDEVNNENITQADVTKFVQTFKKLENVGNNGVTVESVAEEFIGELENCLGGELTDESKEEIKSEVINIYNDTIAEVGESGSPTMENIICVTVSKNMDLSDYDLGAILEGLVSSIGGSKEGEGASNSANNVSYALAEGEVSDGTGGEGTVCTTYSELIEQLGLDESKKAEIKENLSGSLHSAVNESLSDLTKYLGYYGWLFIGVLALILPWFVLFLFSFFHMLAKNKRFMMWYVKLFGFIPALIFVALVGAMPILKLLVGKGILTISEEALSFVSLLLSGISSMTWVCGACYVLLWLISIFWAFPIKHKIRKERKLNKGGKAERPRGRVKEADVYGGNENYDSGLYGTDYGSDSFGGSYGYGDLGGYGSYDYGSDGFDEDYGYGDLSGLGSGYDDDDDLFGSSYDDYGGSLFDDDDDLY